MMACVILKKASMGFVSGHLNIVAECRALRIGIRHCPPFLFLLMGFATIISMVGTYLIVSRYAVEPEIAALTVSLVAVIFLVVGDLVLKGFNAMVEANRVKSEFVSIISHQLGSPLSIFRMTLGLMRQKSRENPATDGIQPELETLTETTDRMIGLVNSLLDVAKIEASRLTLRPQAVRLGEVTKRVADRMQKYAAAHNVTISVRIRDSLPAVSGDPEKIEMVVQNLLDNAIRYSINGGRATVVLVPDGKMIRWSVEDTGVGIPPGQHAYIFQKFFRGGNAVNHDVRGSGIGLYIAKAIVEASGGEIGFSSKEGKGSTFWFTLPVTSNQHYAQKDSIH